MLNLKAQAQKHVQEWNAASAFDTEKDKAQFRRYEEACDRVKTFYAEQHERQTVDFNLRKRKEFEEGRGTRARMSVWQARKSSPVADYWET